MDCQDRTNFMYHLKPILQRDTQFQNSTSMYRLKNLIMDVTTTATSYQSQAVCSDTSVKIDQEILDRQEKLLVNLRRLLEDVSVFSKKLKELQSIHTVHKANCFDLFYEAEIRDFVVNADPDHPPYALHWLPKLWELPLNVTIHQHSSVQSLPNNSSVFDNLKNGCTPSNSIRMTLVWKKIGGNAELIVSPTKYKTVTGEVNVLRFFDYILNPGEDVLQRIRKNEVLDLVHRLGHVSSKDQQLIVTQLQKRLGNETWMCGSAPTIADAAVWSALLRLKKNTLPATLNKYVSLCSEFIGITMFS